MPEQTHDDYRPSATLSDQPWQLPSTLVRSAQPAALTGASSLQRPAGERVPAPSTVTHQAAPQANVWNDVTIAHDSDEVHGDDLDAAVELVQLPDERPGHPSAPASTVLGMFPPLDSQADGRRPTRRVAARPAPGPSRRAGQETGNGRVVGTLVVLGIIIKILFEVLRATGH